MFSILGWIIFGLIVGALAKLVMPGGRERTADEFVSLFKSTFDARDVDERDA